MTADSGLPRWFTRVAVAVFTISFIISIALVGLRWSTLDLQIYRWAGLVVRHGGDLYGLHFPHYRLSFTYPPMAALIFAAVPPISLPILKWLAGIGSIACLVATLWLTWGALGYRRQADRLALTLASAALALWLNPVLSTLSFGQVNLVLMLIVVADFQLPDSRWFKGIGIGLAAGFKLTPLIFIPYLLLTRRFRAAGVALATFALTIAGSLVLLPAQSRKFWFGGLFLDPHRIGSVAYVGNQSLRGALARMLSGAPEVVPYWAACALLVGVGGLLLAAWAARRGNEMLGVVTCALTGLLISPISWEHHWVWVVPGLVVVADMAASAGQRRWPWPWLGLVVLAAPFFVLPQDLVPDAMLQGSDVDGLPQFTGDLYVIVAMLALCLVARHVAKLGRGRSPARAAAARGQRLSSSVS